MAKGTASDYDEMDGPGRAATTGRVFGRATGAATQLSDSRRAFPVTLRAGPEPDVPGTGTHYGTTVLPARPRAPRYKAKVEAAVQNVERWIMAPLRNQTFFSLGELREATRPLLATLNERPFDKTEGSRRSW